MPHRFGLRHAVLSLLLIALTASVWLNMVQLDRVWDKLAEVRAAQGRLEEAVVRLERRAAPASSGGGADPDTHRPGAPAEDWARPGIPIKRAPRPDWISDPTSEPDYQSGGVITDALEADLPHIVPYRSTGSSTATRRVIELVQERLADYHPQTLELQGVLAEAWQMDPNGLWLRVKIRDDAFWSDGTPVSAEDVRFTLGLVRNPNYGTRFMAQFEAVSGVEVLGPKVCEVTFSEPLYTNEDATLRLAPLAAHVYAALTPDQFNALTGLLIGSGPYMLPALPTDLKDQWTRGKPLELVRNPRWRGPPRPAERFRFLIAPESSARLAAVRQGEADLARGAPEQAAALQGVEGVRAVVWETLTSGPVVIVWNTGKRADGADSPFKDSRVRNAMTHALDRERMIRELFGGSARMVSGPFPPSRPSNDPSILPLPYDLSRAEALLDDAGWRRVNGGPRAHRDGRPLGFRIVMPRSTSNAEAWSAYLRDQAGQIGVACTVDILDTAAYQAAIKARDFDGCLAAWAPDSPEPNMKQRYHSAFASGGGDNDGQWRSTEADALIDLARRTLDPERRAEHWRRLHAVIHREQPATFVALRPLVMLVSTRLGNVRTYPMGLERAEMYIRKAGP